MAKRAYVWTYGSTGVALVQIGGVRYEPASGNSWHVGHKRPSARSCVVTVDSQSMAAAKSALKKAISKCGSPPW